MKIDNVLLPRNQEVEMRIQDQFRKFIDEKGIRPQVKRRRVDQLETQIRQHFFNWQQIVQKLLGDFN
jgi:polyhydroxyalkanoate synthesis regulator phasin